MFVSVSCFSKRWAASHKASCGKVCGVQGTLDKCEISIYWLSDFGVSEVYIWGCVRLAWVDYLFGFLFGE